LASGWWLLVLSDNKADVPWLLPLLVAAAALRSSRCLGR
jgi:hypothetical protein